ncbi:hypothetical protein SAMN04488515_1668 [Cognatiyoonia koreensis]|uniref:TFIIB zinc-binding n=1 Tax=Cognatiyoonia koreensis TaxID=364200 RepID=A0A1I0Q4V7_9RHOB|nr:hypothetical protein SAMN04488515_1668 [Cognatiyoonia koreensis]
MPATKVATCCFCGTRAALVLRGRERHELACNSCGAPLSEMKQLHPTRPSATTPARPVQRQRVVPYDSHDRWSGSRKKKRKSLKRRLFSEVLDLIEDIID